MEQFQNEDMEFVEVIEKKEGTVILNEEISDYNRLGKKISKK